MNGAQWLQTLKTLPKIKKWKKSEKSRFLWLSQTMKHSTIKETRQDKKRLGQTRESDADGREHVDVDVDGLGVRPIMHKVVDEQKPTQLFIYVPCPMSHDQNKTSLT